MSAKRRSDRALKGKLGVSRAEEREREPVQATTRKEKEEKES